ncbi:MAG: hypothetical protein JWN03_4622 [Nocardia sp.]|uniref:CoA transferase n=1 Tax=Nocardia sp. TaxID=1821 RepID=UPI00260320A6|nr:CoA transferase [Nocardia sp.]MCU1644347.1 hypothetical protein [Nocardia sp.]
MTNEAADAVVRSWTSAFGTMAPVGPSPALPDCAALAWAASGGMALTGHPDQAPSLSPAAALGLLFAVGRALSACTGRIGAEVRIDPAEILFGRAGLLGYRRAGRVSAGGHTRLLAAHDGWCAITISRPDDIELVPAIVESDAVTDPWIALGARADRWSASQLVNRAQLLGLPSAVLPARPLPGIPWHLSRIAESAGSPSLSGARVVDLSAMWAGPLCARLLSAAGADIIKVESTHRPDGARQGDPRFYEWLHAGHAGRTLDFRSRHGRRTLAELIDSADVVIEASRPRALRQLGLAPGTRPHRAGQVWLSITGYGRDVPDRVAFGDDAAVSGGLVGRDEAGAPVFCGDAIADPLTGVCAALAVSAAVLAGGGQLIDLSMSRTAAAFAAAPAVKHGPHQVHRVGPDWLVDCPHLGTTQQVLGPPVLRENLNLC